MTEAEIEEEAARRHPADHEVADPFGATGWARSDPYGYEDTARAAFIEGAKWAAEQTGGEFVEEYRVDAASAGAPRQVSSSAVVESYRRFPRPDTTLERRLVTDWEAVK